MSVKRVHLMFIEILLDLSKRFMVGNFIQRLSHKTLMEVMDVTANVD